jgi:hypothetical protein
MPVQARLKARLVSAVRDPFQKTGTGTVRFDEWACEEPVRPRARLPVSRGDLLLLHNVTPRGEWETVYISWFCYRRRQSRVPSRG